MVVENNLSNDFSIFFAIFDDFLKWSATKPNIWVDFLQHFIFKCDLPFLFTFIGGNFVNKRY